MANPLIIGFISALAGIGLTNLIPKAEADGSTTILSGDKPIVNVPQNLLQATVELPIRDLNVTFRRFAMPATKGAPQINLQNNINGNRLLSLQLVPDSTSKLTGQVEIEINNKLIMESQPLFQEDMRGVYLIEKSESRFGTRGLQENSAYKNLEVLKSLKDHLMGCKRGLEKKVNMKGVNKMKTINKMVIQTYDGMIPVYFVIMDGQLIDVATMSFDNPEDYFIRFVSEE